jgi:DNA-binding CsgD family transcriptional regulator
MVGETSVHYGVLAIAIAQTSSLSPGQLEAATFLGQMPLGTHFCIFHETAEDMFDTFVPYFRDGLENKEFCLWIVPDALRREQALKLLRQALPDFDHYLAQESIELVIHDEWFFKQGTFDLPAVIGRLGDKLNQALSRGYAGLRMNKSGSRLYKECPRQFPAYESELNALIANGRLIVLCTFSLHESGAKEVLDAARAHQITAARRNGCWEVIETAELKEAVHKIKKPQQHASAPDLALLTARERKVLGEIVKGATSKEAAQTLGISRRTIEFHRANIREKIGVRTTVDLVRTVLGDSDLD